MVETTWQYFLMRLKDKAQLILSSFIERWIIIRDHAELSSLELEKRETIIGDCEEGRLRR